MDTLSRERRSWNMSRIRSRDTKPERIVRSMLHRLGFRFRLHSKKLAGHPDLVLSKYRTAVFVHGCFWHRHPSCKFAYSPKSNLRFWKKKFLENVQRDASTASTLRKMGWNVTVIWECEVKNLPKLAKRLLSILRRPKKGRLRFRARTNGTY